MGTGEITSRLIVIENGRVMVYCLDDRPYWKLGRTTGEELPDIGLTPPTISRSHGLFKNTGGLWLYTDYCKLNGTTYNGKLLTKSNDHKLLEDGDILIFGGAGNAVINPQTVWSIYLKRPIGEEICIVDTREKRSLEFTDGTTVTRFICPEKGTVVDKGTGLGIYMGDYTCLLGNIRLKCS